jgi:hypothetical protein
LVIEVTIIKGQKEHIHYLIINWDFEPYLVKIRVVVNQIVKNPPEVDSLVTVLSLVRIMVADSEAKNYPYVAMV